MQFNVTRCYALSFVLCLLLRARYIQAEDDERSEAEQKGTAKVLVVGLSHTQFDETRESFIENVAHYSSLHCKRKSGNCETEDKHIRSNDVIIVQENEDPTRGVEVSLYIRDRMEDPEEPALKDNQLANVFYDYDDEFIETYGSEVEVLDPQKSWWEWWRILLVTLFSLIVVLLIILGIWLFYDARRKTKAMDQEKQESISRQLSHYDSIQLDTDPAIKDTGYHHLHEQNSVIEEHSYDVIQAHASSAVPEEIAPPAYNNFGYAEAEVPEVRVDIPGEGTAEVEHDDDAVTAF